MFSLEDTNNDGVISYEEFVEAYEEYKSLGIETRTPEENLELFRSLDTNDDNQLDRAGMYNNNNNNHTYIIASITFQLFMRGVILFKIQM